MDASYGTNSALRASIGALALTYVAAILPTVKVPPLHFLRHELVSYSHLPIDFPEESWAGVFCQLCVPVCFFPISSTLLSVSRISPTPTRACLHTVFGAGFTLI
jgi:hypothetical protein